MTLQRRVRVVGGKRVWNEINKNKKKNFPRTVLRYNVNKRRYKNNHYEYFFPPVVKSYLYYSHLSQSSRPIAEYCNNKSKRIDTPSSLRREDVEVAS